MRRSWMLTCAILALAASGWAHVDGHPSIHDTMASIIERLRTTHDANALRRLDYEDIEKFITDDEREVLGNEFWSFEVDTPVTVWVVRHARQRELPFWLPERGFKKTGLEVTADGQSFEVWRKKFKAGPIGLGLSGFEPAKYPYFVVLTPRKGRKRVEVSAMYPGLHRVATVKERAWVYADEADVRLEEVPEELDGQTLLCGVTARVEETQLTSIFRATDFPSSTAPDQVCLTWSDDPCTTQTVQWRTSPKVEDGMVQFRPEANEGAKVVEVPATCSSIEDRYLANDPVNHRYSAVLEGLEAGTAYTYRVGSEKADTWSDWAEFTTAPAGVVPFSFVYMGDAQCGLDVWGELVHHAHEARPDAAFYIMAGDLVNRGNERDDWDGLFAGADGVYDRRPVVPSIGNHECGGGDGPRMYLDMFTLRENGPEGVEAERAYSVKYSNALFVVLDSNLPAVDQADWLEEQLAGTDATWKFVVYHHPAYSSAPRRDNTLIRKTWGAIFDKYHVDMALQGHDHAYLRTYPMKNEQRVDSPAEGTVYVVSNSGTKHYKQSERDYTAKGMTNVSLYQVLDIVIDGNKLTYRAYDSEGKLHDEIVIEK